MELPALTAVSTYATYYFTAEYALKFLTVWAVSARMAGVEAGEDEAPQGERGYSRWYQTYRFFWRTKYLIDFAAIFPSYLQYFAPSANAAPTNFLRILRLLRLVRILRLLRLLSSFKNVDVAVDLIFTTLRQAQLMLSVFAFFALVYVVLMGCLMFIAEHVRVARRPLSPLFILFRFMVHPYSSYFCSWFTHIHLIPVHGSPIFTLFHHRTRTCGIVGRLALWRLSLTIAITTATATSTAVATPLTTSPPPLPPHLRPLHRHRPRRAPSPSTRTTPPAPTSSPTTTTHPVRCLTWARPLKACTGRS